MNSKPTDAYRVRMRYGQWYVDRFNIDNQIVGAYGPFETQTIATTHAETLGIRNGDHR